MGAITTSGILVSLDGLLLRRQHSYFAIGRLRAARKPCLPSWSSCYECMGSTPHATEGSLHSGTHNNQGQAYPEFFQQHRSFCLNSIFTHAAVNPVVPTASVQPPCPQLLLAGRYDSGGKACKRQSNNSTRLISNSECKSQSDGHPCL